MLGKTHIAVGCAIYFYIAQPTDFKSLFADVAISIIGSEVSDIDEANSKVRHVFIWLFQSSSQCYAFYIDRPHSQWYNRSLDRAVWILLFCCISITCFTGYLKSQAGTIILSAENRSQI